MIFVHPKHATWCVSRVLSPIVRGIESLLDGAPVLGPESSSGWFTVGNTIQDTNSTLFLNVDLSPTTSYKPLTLDETAATTTWSLSGDTIITDGQQNFVVCPISGSELWNFYLQTGQRKILNSRMFLFWSVLTCLCIVILGSEMPTSSCTNWITIHLPCLC